MTLLTIQGTNHIDSYLRENVPDTNQGTDVELWIRTLIGNNYRHVHKFDFSALPAGVTINSATLSIYHSSSSTADGRTYGAYRLTQTGMVEADVTWNDYSSGNSWATGGGDFTVTDGATQTVPAVSNWMDFDVLNQVIYARDNVSEIAHFLIKDTDELGLVETAVFHSSEYTGDTSLRPKLVIDYDLGVLNTTSLNQRYGLDAPTLNKQVLNQRYSLTGATLITTFLNQRYALSGVVLNETSLNQRYALSGVVLNETSLNQLYALVVPTGPFSLLLNQRYILNGFHIPATVYHAVTYTLTLTGAPDSLDDIILPMSSFQTRLKAGDPSWLSAISPNSRQNADSINARPNGELVITRNGIKEDGTPESIEIARVELETIRTDEGSFKSSATLVGHKTTSAGTPKGVALELASLKSVYAGKIHVESKMDSNIRPGDEAEHDSQVFIVGEVFIAVNARFTKMRIAEA